MGEARLFIGSSVSMSIAEWVFSLLRSKEQIIADTKADKKFIEEYKMEYDMTEDEIFDDPDFFISDIYPAEFLEDDVKKLEAKLRKFDMTLTVTYNRSSIIRIGRLLPENCNPWLVRETELDIKFWKEYGMEICIFSGLYGDWSYNY